MHDLTRNLKNRIVENKRIMLFFIKLINFPMIGRVYDFFYFRHIHKKIISQDFGLVIEPFNLCNLRCVMCPYKRMKRKKEMMSMALFEKIITEAKSMNCKDIHLTHYNEPFMDKHLFKRISYIKKSGMTSWFYSNATLLGKKMRENLLENPPNLIRFSVDGTKKETFESIRKGAKFEEVVKNITCLFNERNKMKKKLPRIEVFFTLLSKNRKEAGDFLKFWKDKCDFASVYPADSRESGELVGVDYKKLKPYPCFNPKRVYILSSGKVVLCCVDVEGKIELGDLKNERLKDILNSSRFKKVYESHINRECKIEMCRNCSKLYIDSAFTWWIY